MTSYTRIASGTWKAVVGQGLYATAMSTNNVRPVPRSRPPESGTEWESLTGMLDFFRATVVNKVAGLTDEQAFSAVVPPSTLTPGGLVKHLTGTERFWFSIDYAGADLPYPWPDDDRHGAFAIDDGDTLPGLVAAYVAECRRSREAIDGADLDDMARGKDMHFSLRYALLHMIEETARHCGHLDLLRERIDGATGQ
jgi:hypothetical protein